MFSGSRVQAFAYFSLFPGDASGLIPGYKGAMQDGEEGRRGEESRQWGGGACSVEGGRDVERRRESRVRQERGVKEEVKGWKWREREEGRERGGGSKGMRENRKVERCGREDLRRRWKPWKTIRKEVKDMKGGEKEGSGEGGDWNRESGGRFAEEREMEMIERRWREEEERWSRREGG